MQWPRTPGAASSPGGAGSGGGGGGGGGGRDEHLFGGEGLTKPGPDYLFQSWRVL